MRSRLRSVRIIAMFVAMLMLFAALAMPVQAATVTATSISPARGSVLGGQEVVIEGSGFVGSSAMTFKDVGAGEFHACGLSAQGDVYCWGSDGGGQLGHSTELASKLVPTRVALPEGITATQLSVGAMHNCVIGSDGEAYCWGWNGFGQLGNGESRNEPYMPTRVLAPEGVRFVHIDSGSWNSCAIDSVGQAYCWGNNLTSQLGAGSEYGYGNYLLPVPVAMPGGVAFTDIQSSDMFTCALGTDSQAYCWGSNNEGQLGHGPDIGAYILKTPSLIDMPAGVTFSRLSIAPKSKHVCALGSDSVAYCWGSGAYGELGNGANTYKIDVPTPVQMPANEVFNDIAAGEGLTCASSLSGQAYCWGSDFSGQLGNGGEAVDSNVPVAVQMPAGVGFAKVTAGSGRDFSFACGLGTNGLIYCWGYGGYGQLGSDNDYANQTTPAPVGGSGSANISSVMFGDQETTDFVVNSPTQLTVTAPASQKKGAVQVKLKTTDGQTIILKGKFVYVPDQAIKKR